MSEASQKTRAWKDRNKARGLRGVTIWIPMEVKTALENLAYTRKRQSVGELIADMLKEWKPSGLITKTSTEELRIEQKVAQASADMERRLRAELNLPPWEPKPQAAVDGIRYQPNVEEYNAQLLRWSDEKLSAAEIIGRLFEKNWRTPTGVSSPSKSAMNRYIAKLKAERLAAHQVQDDPTGEVVCQS